MGYGITLYTCAHYTCCEELCWYIRLTYLNMLIEWMHLETIREVGASMSKYVYPMELLVGFLCKYGHGHTGYNIHTLGLSILVSCGSRRTP